MKDSIDILSTIPQFVKDKYPKFVSFIDSYFQYLEQPENFVGILENFRTDLDIDNASDETIDLYLNELGLFKLSELKDVYIDKKLLIKSLSEINALAGSEEGFKLFFKIFFNSFCRITKPNLFILSDSSYNSKQYIIISTNNISDIIPFNTKALNSNYLVSTNSSFLNSTSVEGLYFIVVNGIKYAKLEINKPIRNFYLNEVVKLAIDGKEYLENIIKVAVFEIVNPGIGYKKGNLIKLNSRGLAHITEITSGNYNNITIINGGSNYSIGDVINTNISTGKSFQAIVSSVDNNGRITGTEILFGGHGYTEPVINNSNIKIISRKSNAVGANLSITSNNIGAIAEISIIEEFVNFDSNSPISIQTTTGSGAVLRLKNGTNYQDKKYFLNNINTLGSGYIIQDSKTHNHLNSYIINSIISKNHCDNLINEYLHPSGLDKFYSMEISTI